jgi:hypothetical protein
MPTDVEAWVRHNVPAIAPNIDAGSDPDFIGHGLPWMREEEIATATTSEADHRHGQGRLVLLQEPVETLLASVARVDVQDDEARNGARGNTDIGVWPLPPPGLDDRLIGGGIFDAVGCTGMFADRQSKAAAGGLD